MSSPGGSTRPGERRSAAAGRLDPDELALLEEERDHLLASLEDLDREYGSGDMDEVDYLELKDDYTVRTADVLEAIDQQHSVQRTVTTRPGRLRTALVTAGVLAFAVVAGVLVAQGSGQRGDGPISGGMNSLRSELARCQSASFQDPAGGIECYDVILADAPDNVEALTYRGWALIREDRVREGAEDLDRAVEVDPDYPDVRVFRAVVAARAGGHANAAQEIDRFYRNRPTPAAVQILQSQGLEREIFIQLLDESTRSCWFSAATASEAAGASGDGAGEDGARAPQAFISSLGTCLDAVLAESPDDVDALVSRTYALLAPGAGELAQGAELARRAVAADPRDPNARLLHASVALVDDRPEDAAADLDLLDELPRPTISFLIGGPEQLREALAGPSDVATTTTSTAPRNGTPSIPNPDGG